MTAAGPFDNERDALASVPDVPPGEAQNAQYELLVRACLAAGVQLGDFDQRILWWIAGYERSTVGVITGLITRASTTIPPAWAATVIDAFDDARQWRQERLAEPCADCDAAKLDPERVEYYADRCERHTEVADSIGLLNRVAGDMTMEPTS